MKNKLVKRLVGLILAGTMMFGLVACGNSDTKESTKTSESVSASKPIEESEPANSDPVDEPYTFTYPVETDVVLSFYGGPDPYTDNTYDNNPVHMGIEEKTGIGIDWITIAAGTDKTQAYNLLWTEAEQPDIVFGTFENSRTQQLYEDNLIYDLTDYLPEYAPDFWEYMNRPENSTLLKAITSTDGKIFTVPQVQESQYNQTYIGFAIRQDWLDACGLTAPVTIKEWEEVLAAFKEKYDAGLGYTNEYSRSSGLLASGFGALDFDNANVYFRDGKAVVPALEPEYKAMIETMTEWYSKGYIDQDSVTMDTNALRAKALNNEIGIMITAMSNFTNVIADAEMEGNGANWVALGYPRVAPEQPTTRICTSAERATTNRAVITKSASEDDLKLALQFLNYGFTEEGMKYINLGEEGVTYEIGANGRPQFTALLTEDEKGLNEAIKKYSLTSAAYPGIQMSDLVFAKNNLIAAEAVYTWIDNTEVSKYYSPTLSFTEEENDVVVDSKVALRTYLREETVKFFTGARPISEWDKFLEEFSAMDLQEYLDANQAAYDRYMAK